MKEKIKKISKYSMNILAIVNVLLIKLSPVWGWHLEKITDTITIVVGVLGAYLVSGKIFEQEEVQTTFNDDDLESIDTEEE